MSKEKDKKMRAASGFAECAKEALQENPDELNIIRLAFFAFSELGFQAHIELQPEKGRLEVATKKNPTGECGDNHKADAKED